MSFAVSVQERYLEDYIPGSVHTYGSIKIEEADILRFAREFDPQVLHADPEGARDTIFGGLIARLAHRQYHDAAVCGPLPFALRQFELAGS